jgi:hypothetical protein
MSPDFSQPFTKGAHMEHTRIEVALIQETVDEATDAQTRELNELQLAFVGGGIGDVAGF